MKTLNDVQPGRSWWWWFKSPTHELRVFHIVRNGSGALWVDTTNGGRRLDEFNWELLEPVAEPRDQKNITNLISEYETLFLRLRSLEEENKKLQDTIAIWSLTHPAMSITQVNEKEVDKCENQK